MEQMLISLKKDGELWNVLNAAWFVLTLTPLILFISNRIFMTPFTVLRKSI